MSDLHQGMQEEFHVGGLAAATPYTYLRGVQGLADYPHRLQNMDVRRAPPG